jgi:hypothetical protein
LGRAPLEMDSLGHVTLYSTFTDERRRGTNARERVSPATTR